MLKSLPFLGAWGRCVGNVEVDEVRRLILANVLRSGVTSITSSWKHKRPAGEKQLLVSPQ